jgi:hypothetical protein
VPSPPPPTTLYPGDAVWWLDGRGQVAIGTFASRGHDTRELEVRDTRGRLHIVPAGVVRERTTYIPDVVGPGEARALMDGISRQRLSELRQQPHFPPAAELAQGPVWSRPELLAWHRDRTDKRSTPRARFLMSYRKHGSVYAAAKSLGIPASTAYRWAHELDLLDQENETSDG